ncbi:Alkyldihydroxyacetonephosphate synthase (EC [Olavius algarvensis Delta 1 endosymbiont]|nr:Alkyldihydroxyacetonephosphate synthase (EC [Olavius algarvensis Delta 1 endosymbiont]
MQRWNGWGDETITMDLPSQGRATLRDVIGKGRIRPDYPLENFVKRIPPSRLPEHPLISFDAVVRLKHAHGQSLPDWIGLRSGTLQHFPDGVALPSTLNEVRELLKLADEQDAAVIPYGGGTSVVGHLAVPQSSRPVLSVSLERLNRLVGIESDNCLATFEAGIRGPQIEQQLNSRGFTLGHYPQSYEFSSLGGWVATRSSGQLSRHYGRIEDLFAGGIVLTPRGTLNLSPFPASAAGPDLRQILLGSEGKMGVLANVVVKISRLPEKDDVYGVFFPSWEHGQKAVQALAQTDSGFSMVRLSNPSETTTNLALAGSERQISLVKRYLRLRGIPAKGFCMCLLCFTGSRSTTAAARRAAFSIVRRHKGVYIGQPMGRAWKKNRFRSAYLRNTLWDLGYAVDTLETAVTWEKVTPTMQAIEKTIHGALATGNERGHVFSHLSHVYPSGSSIYTTFIFRLSEDPRASLDTWLRIKQAASRTIVAAGGTISHQHGIGSDHREYLPAEKGKIGMAMLQKVFNHLDPDRRMNPGKLIP